MTVMELLEQGATSAIVDGSMNLGRLGEVEMMAVAGLSTAISMKRIADALEAFNPENPSLTHNIEQIAWSAGRSFEQGRRTDR